MDSFKKYIPYMSSYADEFADSGNINWLPYLMYFHPINYQSKVVNTDSSGFGYSEALGRRYSVADHDGIDSVKIIAGSSTVFGIGASEDKYTLPSYMTNHDSGVSHVMRIVFTASPIRRLEFFVFTVPPLPHINMAKIHL